MRSSRHRRRLDTFFLILSIGSVMPFSSAFSAEEEDPPLEIKFGSKTASLSGVIDSEQTGESLARTIKSARPDLDIVNKGLVVREGASIPSLEELKSLLSEIGISTHEGGLRMTDDEVRITGLTDSIVTVTALLIRLEPIKGDRQLVNHICLVPSEDLPDLGVSLSGNDTGGLLINFDKVVTRAEAFEFPGILLSKISPLIDFTNDLDVLAGKKPFQKKDPLPQMVRAVPLVNLSSNTEAPSSEAPVQRVILARPLTSADLTAPPVELEPIRFSRNTVLLQANQTSLVAQWLTVLGDPEFAGQPITIRAAKPTAGSGAFNDWLCERRANEIKGILAKNGIGEELCRIEVSPSQSNVDTGEVSLIVARKPVEIPVEAPLEEEISDEGEKKDVATSTTSASVPPAPGVSRTTEQ